MYPVAKREPSAREASGNYDELGLDDEPADDVSRMSRADAGDDKKLT